MSNHEPDSVEVIFADYDCKNITVFQAMERVEALIDDLKQREVDLTIANLINKGLFTPEELDAVYGKTKA